ncbi:Membrane protein YdfJ [Diplonema papillatum]|nr:Membrane protein YdfJ [Diplonema papillatum]
MAALCSSSGGSKEGCERFSVRYVRWIHKRRYAVAAGWLAFCAVMSYFATDFISKTDNSFNAEPGTKVAKAIDVMGDHFPSLTHATNLVVYFEAKTPILDDGSVKQFDEVLRAQLNASYSPVFMPQYNSYWTMVNETHSEAQARKYFVSPNGLTTFIAITINVMSTDPKAMDCADAVQDAVDAWSFEGVEVTCLGLPSIVKTLIKSTEANMGTVDAVSIPLALVTLMWILKSARLLIIPLANMGLTAASSFGVMSVLAGFMSVNTIAPSLMMTILVAMSIDYNLFLLTRYRQELLAVPDDVKISPTGSSDLPQWRLCVISTVIDTAGQTITVSALTLGVCFLGLLMFPMSLIQSIGLANALTIVMTLLVNISVTPTLLLIFPAFFEKCVHAAPPSGYLPVAAAAPGEAGLGINCADEAGEEGRGFPSGKEGAGGGAGGAAEAKFDDRPANTGEAVRSVRNGGSAAAGGHPDDTPPARDLAAADKGAPPGEHRNLWWRVASFTMAWPYNAAVAVAIVVFVLPCCFFAFNGHYTDSMELFLPRGASVTRAYVSMADQFGLGSIYPTTALIVLRDVSPWGSVDHPEFYKGAAKFAYALIQNVEYMDNSSVASTVFADGRPVPYAVVLACRALMVDPAACAGSNESAACRDCFGVLFAEKMFTSADRRAVLLNLSPKVDPLGEKGAAMRRSMLDVADRHADALNSDIYYTGYNPITWDTMWFILDLLPMMIVVEGTVVFVILAVVFRSIVIPLRSVATIMITISWTFGLSDLVYEHDLLGWTHVHAFASVGAIVWTNVIVLFSMIVGIGLDYDIFLLTRVKEFYQESLVEDPLVQEPERTLVAVHKGLRDTGHVITAAGLIMAMAFSGLFFSDIPTVNQMGFYLVFSVLFDTLVVRSLLVPAVMSLLGKWNWWPRAELSACFSSNGYTALTSMEGIR